MKKVMKHHFTIGVLTGAMMLSLIAPGKSFAQTLKPIIKADVYEIDDQGENGYINVIPATETDVVEKTGLRRSAEARFVPDDLYTSYPQIRNQGEFGTCWAHSTAALGEFSAYKKYDKLFNTSEMHIVYYTYNTVEKSKYGNTVGDTTSLATTNTAEDNIYQYGGNIGYSSNALLNWKGYASEEDFPYFEDVDDKELALTYDKTGYTDANAYKDYLRVVGVYEVNLKDDPDYAKELIKTYGAISASFCADYDDGYWEDNNCYYASRIRKTNHSISIVGWDDNFSKENFCDSFEKTPSKDGAWLVRNSWGGQPNASGNARYEDFNGYFWLSYYEPSINYVDGVNYEPSFAVEVITPGDKEYYDNNYSYDGGLANLAFTSSTGAKAANVFKCEKVESLKAVGAYLLGTNTEYTVSVYKLKKGFKNPEDGTCLDTVKIRTEYAGFYTKSLNKAFEIYPGDVFSVVVTMPSGKGIAKEHDVGWAGDFSTNSPSKASYAYNGSWYDYGAATKTNFRIKAYTNNLSMTGYRAITYVLSGGINNPENPSYFKEGTGVSAFLAPERNGYDFEGWFFDDKFTKSASGINADVRNDVTVYAKWKKNTAPVQPHQCIMNQMCADSKYLRTPADYNMPATYYLSCTCGRFNTVSGYFFSGSPLKRTFLTDCDIYLSKSVYKYDGREKCPTVTVTLNKKTVPKSAYYCLYYSNVNKGTASVFVIANCGANDPVMGSAILNFSIVDNPNEITLSKKSYVLSASSKNQTFYISAKAAAGDIVYKSDTSSVKVSGTGKVTVKKNFVGKATITLSAADASRGTATARVTVKAELAKPSVKTVSSPSKGKIKITWKKPSVASGVEIQYSTDKKFTKSKRVTYEIKGTKTTSKTFAKLKKGKKYYVRLRTYKTVSGERIYSKYSAIKSVKVKK